MRRILVALVVLAVIGGAVFWFLTVPKTLAATDLPDHTPDKAKGEYIFNAAGCAACHADPSVTDTTAAKELPGGLEIPSPFGTFFAPNISPDKEHGIGNWTTLDFVNAMKFGVTPDGSHLYPAFPYASYQHMTLEDIIDLKAYLDTLPAVATSPKPHALPFPFNIRRGIGLWKIVAGIDGETLAPDPSLSAELNRGAYLVRGPGHCGECHTPRTLWGTMRESVAFSGGPSPEGKGRVPNITPDPTGIGKMSVEDFTFNLIMLGFNRDGKPVASGGMGKVVRELGKLTAEDQTAIFAYLKSMPAVATVPAAGAAEDKD